jgi:hypothetical protein
LFVMPDYISNFFDDLDYREGPTLMFKGVE